MLSLCKHGYGNEGCNLNYKVIVFATNMPHVLLCLGTVSSSSKLAN